MKKYGANANIFDGAIETAKTIKATGMITASGVTPPASPPEVTGSRGGNAALASLLTALESLGFIVDNTTA